MVLVANTVERQGTSIICGMTGVAVFGVAILGVAIFILTELVISIRLVCSLEVDVIQSQVSIDVCFFLSS